VEREAAIDEAAELVEETHVDDRVIASLRAERVRAAIAALPNEQRVVLSLAFWSGLSQREIADRTGTPLGTVKSRVRLGMSKLRERLRIEMEIP
jgi:RNA polymerase sigma-70 factor (ECF subfamily)